MCMWRYGAEITFYVSLLLETPVVISCWILKILKGVQGNKFIVTFFSELSGPHLNHPWWSHSGFESFNPAYSGTLPAPHWHSTDSSVMACKRNDSKCSR